MRKIFGGRARVSRRRLGGHRVLDRSGLRRSIAQALVQPVAVVFVGATTLFLVAVLVAVDLSILGFVRHVAANRKLHITLKWHASAFSGKFGRCDRNTL